MASIPPTIPDRLATDAGPARGITASNDRAADQAAGKVG